MPIELAAFAHPPLVTGFEWKIRDRKQLANLVGRLVLGNYYHVEKILQGAMKEYPQTSLSSVQRALEDLASPDNEPARWHRDGWLFQLIAWIAAQAGAGEGVYASVPHARPTMKGFDCVLVRVSKASAQLEGVTICEDKATELARKTVTQEVWPEIKSCETGARDSELLSNVTAILSRYDQTRLEQIIQAIHWKNQREYRVSISVDDKHLGLNGREKLFKGYDTVVPGDVSRRRGETIHFVALRAWMDEFAAEVSEVVREIGEDTHV